MQDYNRDRDVLVLTPAAQHNPQQMERELALLNRILYETENWNVFATANELIDINRRKIIRKTHLIQQMLTEKEKKPFVFTCNKN